MRSTVGRPRHTTDAQVAIILEWHAEIVELKEARKAVKTLRQLSREMNLPPGTIFDVVRRRGVFKQPTPELREQALHERRVVLEHLRHRHSAHHDSGAEIVARSPFNYEVHGVPVINNQIKRENFRQMRRVRRYIGRKVNSYCIGHRLTDQRFSARSGMPMSVLQSLRRDQYDMSFLDLWTFASLLDTTALQLMQDAHVNRMPRLAVEGDIFLVEAELS